MDCKSNITAKEVKDRMKSLNLKQVKMIRALRNRGLKMDPANMSKILNEVVDTEGSRHVLSLCNDIMDEYESKLQSVALV